jgi:prepilin peptidase CpaA
MAPALPLDFDALSWSACMALLAIAALHDVIARTIPNWIPTTVALVGLVPLLRSPAALDGLLAAALVFAGGVLFWRLGLMGGGDAKLLGAVGLLVPPGRMLGAMAAIGLAGGVLALPYLMCRGRIAPPAPARPSLLPARAWRAERFRLRRGGPVPYGVAIAVGTALVLFGGPP